MALRRRSFMALAAISLVGLVGMFFSGKILGMHEEKLGIFPFDDCCVNTKAFREEMKILENTSWAPDEKEASKAAIFILRNDVGARQQQIIGRLFNEMRTKYEPKMEEMKQKAEEAKIKKEKTEDEGEGRLKKAKHDANQLVTDTNQRYLEAMEIDQKIDQDEKEYDKARNAKYQDLLITHHELLREKAALTLELRRLRKITEEGEAMLKDSKEQN
ncbi:hypothetical protein AAMO2058_001274700 [Amorphochlora amoebiformis]